MNIIFAVFNIKTEIGEINYMKKEDILLEKRLLEMAEKSYKNSMYYFTGFLSAPEISLLYDACKIEASSFTVFGGAEGCERRMVRFGSEEDLGYEVDFPICTIKVEPLLQKFSDEFTHRDFLGAIMNLGIERDTIGDIIIKENTAYIFVTEKMTQYIIDNLDKVKHTHMKCSIVQEDLEEAKINLEAQEILVSSFRIDAVLAKLYNQSRNQALELFKDKKVYVNGRLCENNSYIIKTDDVISVRGFGKAIYRKQLYETKKGKYNLQMDIYV